jgi:hypothetical protein
MYKCVLDVISMASILFSGAVTHTLECNDSIISFVQDDYVVKQIRNTSPDEQFLLVIDATACHIGNSVDVRINTVYLSPPGQELPGKRNTDYPATIHTLAEGVGTNFPCTYQNIDIQQRCRDGWVQQAYGLKELKEENRGLTPIVIYNMSLHNDLPAIVALDTFTGNADRNPENLFYDSTRDHFCGIDMAAAFTKPLAEVALTQLTRLDWLSLSTEEHEALLTYHKTLKTLLELWPPERQIEALLAYSEAGGFTLGSHLWIQNVADRIEYHKKRVRQNYENTVKLMELISSKEDARR